MVHSRKIRITRDVQHWEMFGGNCNDVVLKEGMTGKIVEYNNGYDDFPIKVVSDTPIEGSTVYVPFFPPAGTWEHVPAFEHKYRSGEIAREGDTVTMAGLNYAGIVYEIGEKRLKVAWIKWDPMLERPIYDFCDPLALILLPGRN